uniref:Uncharacterized protein n=1 Tax=Micrurus corallinus TaxID=54390 RepID=A0A2D4EWS4_MICCO
MARRFNSCLELMGKIAVRLNKIIILCTIKKAACCPIANTKYPNEYPAETTYQHEEDTFKGYAAGTGVPESSPCTGYLKGLLWEFYLVKQGLEVIITGVY